MIFRSMRKREGSVPRIGRTLRATGLYFFFAAKIASGASVLVIVQIDRGEGSQSRPLVGGVVVLQLSESQASK